MTSPEFSGSVFSSSTVLLIPNSYCETAPAGGYCRTWPRRAVSVNGFLTTLLWAGGSLLLRLGGLSSTHHCRALTASCTVTQHLPCPQSSVRKDPGPLPHLEHPHRAWRGVSDSLDAAKSLLWPLQLLAAVMLTNPSRCDTGRIPNV